MKIDRKQHADMSEQDFHPTIYWVTNIHAYDELTQIAYLTSINGHAKVVIKSFDT